MISVCVLLLLIASNVEIGSSTSSADQPLTFNRNDAIDHLSNSMNSGLQQRAENSTAAKGKSEESMSKLIATRLHRAHGILMLLAWFLFITIGIIYARYFRGYDKTWSGTQVWFLMHRGLNIIGVVLIIAGFLCIFISEKWAWKGPRVNGGEKNWTASAIHSLVGLLCVILAWIQSLAGFVRPSPSSAMRPFFNWMHRSIGIVAFVLAVATIVIAGIGINRWSNRHVALILIVVFIVCLIIAVGACEMTSFLEKTQWAKTISIASSKASILEGDYSNSYRSSSQRRLRFIFGVFGCIAVVISITLSVLVALSGD